MDKSIYSVANSGVFPLRGVEDFILGRPKLRAFALEGTGGALFATQKHLGVRAWVWFRSNRLFIEDAYLIE